MESFLGVPRLTFARAAPPDAANNKFPANNITLASCIFSFAEGTVVSRKSAHP